MPILLHRSIFLFLILSPLYHFQQVDITGIWYFDRFGGPHGEIAESSDIVKANSQNKGVTFTFTKEGKFTSSKPGGSSSTLDYQVSYNLKQVIIGRDTLKIMLLTKEILELYPKNESRPALFLKRSKDGKTLMSAP